MYRVVLARAMPTLATLYHRLAGVRKGFVGVFLMLNFLEEVRRRVPLGK